MNCKMGIKIFLFATAPVWSVVLVIYLIAKDLWKEVSDWVDERS